MKAIKVAPRSTSAHALAAALYNEIEKYEDAIISSDIALNLNSMNVKAYEHKIVALKKLGRDQEAEQVMLQMNPIKHIRIRDWVGIEYS